MSVIRCKIPSNSVEWSDPNGKPGRKDFEMENYIMLDGRKFELDSVLAEKLRATVNNQKLENEKKRNPFERQKKELFYYFIDIDGTVGEYKEKFYASDDDLYNIGNYCTDKKLMSQRALHETLNRLLWRFSLENGGDGKWNGNDAHYYITFQSGVGEKKLQVDWTSQWRHQGTVFFSSRCVAERAIDEIVKPFMVEHPEFVW